MPQFLVHGLQLTTREVLVLRQLLVHRLQEHLVVDLADVQARFVHDRDDALVRRLDQVADDLIVEVLDVGPRDAFSLVFLLLLFQHELDEQLLQLFVAVVDAASGKANKNCEFIEFQSQISPKLFKAVDVEYFEAVNVENADDAIESLLLAFVGNLDGFVDATDDPSEQTVVNRFRQRISAELCAGLVVALLHDVAVRGDDSLRQRLRQLALRHVQHFRERPDLALVLDDDFVVLRAELDVSQMENR